MIQRRSDGAVVHRGSLCPSLHALHLMLGCVLLLALQLGLGTRESLVVGTGEFFVHLVDSDINSTGGCTIISVTPDFFFVTLKASFSFANSSFSSTAFHSPFLFPLLSLRAPMSGTGCPLTHEFNNSGGESPEWVRTNTGKGRVGGLSQAVGPGLRTELAGPHSHDCHWM